MSRVRTWFERTFDYISHQAAPDVHRIGSSGTCIVRVKRIEYIDAAGRGQFVDLEECARNWVRWSHNHRQEFLPLGGASQAEIDAENARTVGLRGGSYPLWWAEFMNERKTRFEFGTLDERWGKASYKSSYRKCSGGKLLGPHGSSPPAHLSIEN